MHTEVRNIKYVNIATYLFKLVSYLSSISCTFFMKGTSPRDFQDKYARHFHMYFTLDQSETTGGPADFLYL